MKRLLLALALLMALPALAGSYTVTLNTARDNRAVPATRLQTTTTPSPVRTEEL